MKSFIAAISVLCSLLYPDALTKNWKGNAQNFPGSTYEERDGVFTLYRKTKEGSVLCAENWGIAVTPKSEYLLSVQAKVQNGVAQAYVQFLSEPAGKYPAVYTAPAKTENYELLTAAFTVPPDVSRISIRLYVSGVDATAYFKEPVLSGAAARNEDGSPIDIIASPAKGIIPVQDPGMVLVPQPHEISPTGKMIPLRSCVVTTAPNASATERSAAEEVAAQIEHLGGKASLRDDDAPVHIALGTDLAVFKKFGITSPGRPESYTIRSIADGSRTVIAVCAADRFGVYWGAQTLKQLMRKGDTLALVDAAVRDWPDVPVRMSYRLFDQKPDVLDLVIRFGRPNWTIYEPIDWRSELIFDAAKLKQHVAVSHAKGMRVIGDIGFPAAWKFYDKKANGNFCPIDDLAVIEKLIDDMYAAGIEGLSFRFDDLNGYERLINHFKTHEPCKRFSTLTAWQTYLLARIVKRSERLGGKLFITCPTFYYTFDPIHAAQWTKSYQRFYPDFSAETYVKGFSEYAGSSSVINYFCGFTQSDRRQLADLGIKRYAWWNNGPWSPEHGEVWKAFVSFARMGYSWFCYDNNAIDNTKASADFIERFDAKKIAELSTLADTEIIMHGTGDTVGLAIGHAYSWNIRAYMPNEEAIRSVVINNIFGRDMSAEKNTWEAKAKPLIAKYYQLEPYTAADIADVNALQGIVASCARFETPLSQQQVRKMNSLTDMIGKYTSFFEEAEVGTAVFSSSISSLPGNAMLALHADAAASGENAFTITGRPVSAITYRGSKGLFFSKNKLSISNAAYSLDRRSFTVESYFVPVNLSYFKLIGTRDSYRESYKKLPGWALGCELNTEKMRFIIEDTANTIDTILAPVKLERFKPCHLVAVRDWDTKKLTLYINGTKAGEVPETGSGDFGGKGDLMMSYDNWTGGYFQGVMHFTKIYGKAMPENVVRERAKNVAEQ